MPFGFGRKINISAVTATRDYDPIIFGTLTSWHQPPSKNRTLNDHDKLDYFVNPYSTSDGNLQVWVAAVRKYLASKLTLALHGSQDIDLKADLVIVKSMITDERDIGTWAGGAV